MGDLFIFLPHVKNVYYYCYILHNEIIIVSIVKTIEIL